MPCAAPSVAFALLIPIPIPFRTSGRHDRGTGRFLQALNDATGCGSQWLARRRAEKLGKDPIGADEPPTR